MRDENFSSVHVCIFDAYGTLFDHASAVASCGDVLGAKVAPLAQAWRDKQLAYSWLRAAQGLHADFRRVTGDALDYTMERFGLRDAALRERLMESYRTLDAFPDVPDTLRRLKAAGLTTAILSNGTHDMLRTAVAHAGIGQMLDAVLSVEDVAVFKPHPKVYRLALERLRVTAEEVVFVSSNGWDAYAASAFGLPVVWCNRYGQCAERLPGKPDRVIASLAELAPLLGA